MSATPGHESQAALAEPTLILSSGLARLSESFQVRYHNDLRWRFSFCDTATLLGHVPNLPRHTVLWRTSRNTVTPGHGCVARDQPDPDTRGRASGRVM